jgi:hypothetical protein
MNTSEKRRLRCGITVFLGRGARLDHEVAVLGQSLWYRGERIAWWSGGQVVVCAYSTEKIAPAVEYARKILGGIEVTNHE